MGTDQIYVAVVGGSDPEPTAEAKAETVGRLLARAGAIVICGGRSGVMEAVCRGAGAEDGTTVGFLPGSERHEANSHLSFAFPTGMGEMRNMLVVTAADVVIAVSGEFGTLSEIAFALRVGKPVVGLDTWELAKRGERTDAIRIVDTPEEAVDVALDLAAAR